MKSAKPHKNQLHFVGGIDNGFGNYKLLLEEHPLIVVPSYLSQEKMEPIPGRVRLEVSNYLDAIKGENA
jgi:hypothetical protein